MMEKRGSTDNTFQRCVTKFPQYVIRSTPLFFYYFNSKELQFHIQTKRSLTQEKPCVFLMIFIGEVMGKRKQDNPNYVLREAYFRMSERLWP